VGVFVQSANDLKALRKHFRRFLMVQAPSGETLYFRFYDPRVLPIFLGSCDPAELQSVFGPVRLFAFTDEERKLMTASLRRCAPAGAQMQSPGFAEPWAAVSRAKIWSIREEQIKAFVAPVMASFVRRTLEHMRRQMPGVWQKMTQREAEAAVREGVEQARRYGFEREPEIVRFLEIRTLLGPGFGESPQHRLALEMLHDEYVICHWPASRGLILSIAETGS